ncbi:ATP-binding protein [Undibacterium parvum]|uniref:histidine kinase n=1 Tax=Undibacterium parvum TaxID=401471 RepID=A0A3Q9BRD2_9BURK|nr:ATP-binding protein [Undibacterium parvum]AZP11919.1 GGDEF domain-containing protein [Undibacterium parvum]
MDIFVTNDEVVQAETALPGLVQKARLQTLLFLAWHLRQRDSARALALSTEAEILILVLAPALLTADEDALYSARLLLVRAELKLLYSALGEAQQMARAALLEFQRIEGVAAQQGCLDAHYLLAMLGLRQGVPAIVEAELALAAALAQTCQDGAREIAVQAFQAIQTSYQNLPLALERWQLHFQVLANDFSPGIACCANEFLFYGASTSGNFAQAAAYGLQAYEYALQSGQISKAIGIGSNIGDSFNNLNDHQSALQWMQRSLDLARSTAWPVSVGNCLTQMAETLRKLGRLDAAKEMLDEALPLVASMRDSRQHLMALRYLGDLLLDQGEYFTALDCFSELQERADQSKQVDYKIGARRGRAHALSQLGRPQEALLVAAQALQLTLEKEDKARKIDVLRVLATIYTQHNLPKPGEISAASASLHYLQLALDTTKTIHGYSVPSELLEEIADAQAAVGNYQKAFKFSRQAIAAREKIHTQEAANRATAVQLSNHTERMRAEAEHLRQLANAEADRAEVLQKSSAILSLLGDIGQEITASLDADAVFQTINRHVQGLLHVTAFVIYLMDADQQSMSSAFGVENGVPIEPDTIQLSDPTSRSVQCIAERREIMTEITADEEIPGLIPGTERVLSMLFAPLIIADKVLGVMTIQSSREHAYGDSERMIFRSLCAYGAIALSNADAYLRLKQTQAYLVAQEKLAALGALVAGVAHELNTPIGNCLLVASTVQDNSKKLIHKLSDQSLRRSELTAYCEEVKSSADIMMRGLTSAATLISSFKQVAVDRTSEQRRSFDLQQVLKDIVATLNIRISHAGHAIRLEVASNIKMDSYPGSLGQVITNLIENAILHAFEGEQIGNMLIKASSIDGKRVLLEFSDDGSGIPAENLTRIFDPFFTTKLGQGGSGLGLNICYNIVTSILNGQISVHSEVGAGTRFSLDLPLSI